MKLFLLYFMFGLYVSATFSQSTIRTLEPAIQLSENTRWDLNQYVWSHTHPQPKKGDKPLLDFNAIDNWISLSDDITISQDGNYIAYGIQRGQRYSGDHLDTIIVQATDNSWRRAFPGAQPGFFSADSKLYIFRHQLGLCFLETGTNRWEYMQDVVDYKLPDGVNNKWLACQLKNNDLVLQNLITGKKMRFTGVTGYSFDISGKWLVYQLNSDGYQNESVELVIYNLSLEREFRFKGVISYLFDATGNSLLLKTMEKINNANITALQYVNPLSDESVQVNGSLKKIWSTTDTGINVTGYSIDGSGRQVIFLINNAEMANNPGENQNTENSIWYWREGMDKAEIKVNNKTKGIDSHLFIKGDLTFTDNGRYIRFALQQRPDLRQPLSNVVKVNIRDYKDIILQSAQNSIKRQPRTFDAIFNIKNSQVIKLEKEYEKFKILKGDYAVVATTGQEIYGDRFWEKGYNQDSNWLVSLRDGSRRLLSTKGRENYIWFSPGGNYLVYFDADQQSHYFSYNLHTGQLAKISAGIPGWQLGYQDYGYYKGNCKWKQPIQPVDGGLAGWLEKDKGLLVYDAFDIWKLDISGKKPPVKVTNGRLHGIKFDFINNPMHERNYLVLPNQVILKAFNIHNKNSGYYRKVLDSPSDPELLFMGPCFTQYMEGTSVSDVGMEPLKAANADTWIVKKQSANEPSNYYVTHDFKHFEPLTNLHPHTEFNWFTTEMHSFQQLDGIKNQGLLYKPENFDPTRKYPVVIIFYDRFTDNLNQFPNPDYNLCAISFGISPAWLVSHGYLVFTPDLYMAPLQYGPRTFNIIEGAVKYLKQLSYVDGKHIGACAHSMSAKLGTYIFTHSKSIAAMAISEGFVFSNPINLALSLDDAGNKSLLQDVENGFEYGNLWKNKASWLDQTAVLNADKAISPLLLFCGKNSFNSRTNQTFQLFSALRRLEKRVWWLEYEKGTHIVIGDEARDFTIRFTQFFDHYLKGAPPPKWMIGGLPANLKGIECRYELVQQGRCGKKCSVCEDGKQGNK